MKEFKSKARKNLTLRYKSLGKIELRFISIKDFQIISKLISDKQLNDKEFVQKVLHNQLKEPEIDFKKFKELKDFELKNIAKAYIKYEDKVFQYFKDTGNFYLDFRNAFTTYREEQIEKLRKSLEPIIKSSQQALKSFSVDYSKLFTPAIQESLKKMAGIGQQLSKSLKLTESFGSIIRESIGSLKPFTEQYQSIIRNATESFIPRINFLQNWTEQNKSIFTNFIKKWAEFEKQYKIAEPEAVRILQKYKWFITPSFPLNFIFKVVQIGKKRGRHDREINELFINYFSSDNWQLLEVMVLGWENNSLFKNRSKILLDCVLLLKQSNGKIINATNAVLPSVIAQIDGILSDYLTSKNIEWQVSYDDYIQKGKVKRVGRKSQFQKNKTDVLTEQLDELANDVFLNILFQRSQKGIPLKTPFNFNRHKIMHGESTSYGRKDYLIRAFLVLDFMASLK